MDPDVIWTLWMATYLVPMSLPYVTGGDRQQGSGSENTPLSTNAATLSNKPTALAMFSTTDIVADGEVYCKQINTLDTYCNPHAASVRPITETSCSAMQCRHIRSQAPHACKYSTRVRCLETATLNPSFRGPFHAATNGPILSEYHTTGRKKRELDDT
ncbi:uncharacterized protein FPRO_06383 [Fusarium proliferatum ET1]|uniref:Uncharacterized protein n=1 Tax=Fusarium proliferatum (strain ET1) TaxID=1227346 RepID=A0A1L7VFA8_FUSPR|nr:uncharacterized protein FPRO_06383 [Fusarium proliferatum ET1]CZR38426.1 uncharacterized protein FPRO_06383 [Fusarium proliferatum ET1]